jgi:outer membrane protein OmpA-like peptidoglycan-associated protein
MFAKHHDSSMSPTLGASPMRDALLRIFGVLLLSIGVADVGFLNLTIAPRVFVKERGLERITPAAGSVKMNESLAGAGPAIPAPREEFSLLSPKASPEKAPLKKTLPEQASPEQASPEQASPEKALPEQVSAETNSDNLPTAGPSEVLFRTSSAAITQRAEKILEDALEYLTINPKISLLIKGHSDIRGTSEINNLLSFRRAKSTKNWLVDHGAPTDRIRIKGLGARYPSPLVGTVDVFFQKNRRVELIWQF